MCIILSHGVALVLYRVCVSGRLFQR